MNYYERHLGDYAKDAGHLSMLEHGAYTLLLDRYYTTEDGIPVDQAYRICRARTPAEKAAVDTVLVDFFKLEAGCWHQKRVDAEIARFREKQPDREAQKGNDRERQRRTRERRKAMFDLLRENGIVPAYDTPMSELQALVSRVASQHVTPPVTRDATATQTPDTRHQTPSTHNSVGEPTTFRARAPEFAEAEAGQPPPPPDPADSGHEPTPAGRVCRAMRQAGLTQVNHGDPRLLALLAQGATEAEFVGLAFEATNRGKGWAWVLVTLAARRREAAAIALAPKPEDTAGRQAAEETARLLAEQRAKPKTQAPAHIRELLAQRKATA